MRIQSLALVSALSFCMTPAITFAQLPLAEAHIANHTLGFGTAKTDSSPCSSDIGEQGILQPHGAITIPQLVFDLFCNPDCKINLYMSKSCEEDKKVATLSLDHDDGVTGISNTNHDGYVVSGAGFALAVDGGPNRR